MFLHTTQERVRYADTDQMGFMYYGNYAKFYEIGRVEALRAMGMSYKKMEEDGIMLPVLENYSKFIRPAKYDNLVTIKTMLKEMPSTRVRFEYELYDEEGALLNIGYTTLVFLSVETQRPCKAPESLLQLLAPHFDNTTSRP
ncbi:thioesterase family protein [Algivirga pacifica]|uniref:Thioesterase family protein n=1 Tax=Algivirga pacifica TaxID=1162670 RepID=A0ABP9D5W5_9BACT